VGAITRPCPVRLTEAEKVSFGEALARETALLAETEDNLAAMRSDFKAKAEEHRAQINRISRIIQNGYESREVPCQEKRNFEENSVIVFRVDTGEIVETRAMTDADRQMEIKA
jgi:hypothetical protein